MSTSLNLVWVSPAKALRTDSSPAAMLAGKTTKQEMHSLLAFCNHVVGFLNALGHIWGVGVSYLFPCSLEGSAVPPSGGYQQRFPRGAPGHQRVQL